MKDYFKSKIGQIIKVRYNTGKTFFTEVYERQYTIEIVSVIKNEVTCIVNSVDYVPSGYIKGSTDKYLGERKIKIIPDKSLENIIESMLIGIDPNFFFAYQPQRVV